MLYAMFCAQIYILQPFMFRSTCLGFLCHVSFVLLLSLLCVVVRVMLCSDLWDCMLFAMFYAQINIRTCLYAQTYVLPCLCASLHMVTHVPPCLCLDLCFYMLVCPDLSFHMLICLDLCSFMLVCLDPCSMCFMPPSMCLYVPCCDYVLRLRLCLSCHVLLQPFCCSTFLSCVLAYWFGPDLDPMVFVIVHTPWPILKGFTNPILHVYACLLLCFMLVLASLVLRFATFDTLSGFVVMWLHPMPMRPCSDITIQGYITMMPIAMICLPCLFAPPVGFLCILTRLLTCPCISLMCQCVILAST